MSEDYVKSQYEKSDQLMHAMQYDEAWAIRRELHKPLMHLLNAGDAEGAFAYWEKLALYFPFGLHHGTAFLTIGAYRYAAAVFADIRQKHIPKVPIPHIGISLWLAGDREAACLDWRYEIERRRSHEVTHMDAAGGIEVPALLWWASAHEGLRPWRRLALSEIRGRRKLPTLRRRGWPGPIGDFILQNLTADQLLGEAETSAELLQRRQQCQAHFYIAGSLLLQDKKEEYAQELQRCLEIGEGTREIEMWLARYELQHRSFAS